MYTFYWLDGKREVLEGDSIPDAFRKSGYGAGAMSALDFTCNGDNKEYCWNKTKHTWDKKKVNSSSDIKQKKQCCINCPDNNSNSCFECNVFF